MKTIFLLISLIFTLNIFPQQYEVVKINSLIYPQQINNKKQIIGTDLSTNSPMIWDNGNSYNIPNVSDGYGSGINDSSVACGGQNTYKNIFLYRNGTTTIIPENGIQVSNINNKSWVTGFIIPKTGFRDAFIYNGSSIIDLGNFPGYLDSWGRAINDSGYVAVSEFDTTTGTDFPFVYKKSLKPLSIPADATGGEALDINNQNFICGEIFTSSGEKPVLWDNAGTYTKLPMLDGNQATAKSINESNIVVGNASYSSAGFTVGVLWQNGKIYNLNDLIDSTLNINITNAISINDNGDILCKDDSGYVILSPSKKGSIIQPDTSELVLANSKYEIKWKNAAYKTLDLQFSTDDGTTFTTVKKGISGDADSVSWKVPDIVKAKCRIRLVDESSISKSAAESSRFNYIQSGNTPNYIESGRFKVKGYKLTRLDANGEYQVYRPDKDGWQFANDSAHMWPEEWWNQFDYSSQSTDPYTNKPYDDALFVQILEAYNFNFPDWPLFVKAYGVDQCYLNVYKGIYRISALIKWRAIKDAWNGSCFGLAVSSLASFGNKDQMVSDYPDIGSFNNLAQLKINDDRRELINLFWTRQFGLETYLNSEAHKNTTPWETLQEIKNMFMSKTRNDRNLALFFNDGAHSVTPYKVSKSGKAGVYNLYIYDNDFPLDTTRIITVDSTKDSWSYRDYAGADRGLILDPYATDYLYKPTLLLWNSTGISLSKAQANNFLELYNTPGANINIENKEGKEIGFTADSVINQFTSGIPIIPIGADTAVPIGYFIPDESYNIRMSNYPDSLSRISIMGKDIIFSAYRKDAQHNQTDNFNFNDGFSIANSDNISKDFNLTMIIPADSSELTTEIQNVEINKGDSLKLNRKNINEVDLINYSNSPKTYDLKLWYASTNDQAFFNYNKINITANTTDEIVPDWQHLDSQKVLIRIDLGNNGTIDDSAYFKNQLTGINGENGKTIPSHFALFQNYPNPFNPSTTIKYEIPKETHVTLKVYDILGNEVETLVNKEQQAGSYSVRFSIPGGQIASGIYFYRLQAGNFVQTKKMLLLK